LKEGVILKKMGIFILTVFSIMLGGCGRSQTNATISTGNREISKDIYYTTSGYAAMLSDKYMAALEKGLRIIDLSTKKVIKEIELPDNYAIGYDIYGKKVVWSAYSSQEEIGKDPGYDETANTDIFLYDIATGKTKQITSNKAGQIMPRIWGDYIVWEDNRNDRIKDKNPEWDIYLYNISSGEEKLITNAPGIHTNPSINDNKVVWEDERNGISTNDVIVNGNEPNSDIFLYDIELKKEYLMTGKEPQVMPVISSNYIAYTTSRQINSEIQVIKYK
jgi:beta propeller repeat protein